jgi:hypothetical protein
MADKRIKDLAATATSPAGDDFIAIDGESNNTRKISASLFFDALNFPSDYDSFEITRDEFGNVTEVEYIKDEETIATATLVWDTEAVPNRLLSISNGSRTMTFSYDEGGNITGGALS